MFKKTNPETKLGRMEFYSLRPKWLKVNPKQVVGACVCYKNFELCFSALNSLRYEAVTKQQLLSR